MKLETNTTFEILICKKREDLNFFLLTFLFLNSLSFAIYAVSQKKIKYKIPSNQIKSLRQYLPNLT